MAELGDEDTSELVRVNQDKTKEAAVILSKLEVSFSMSSPKILEFYTDLLAYLH